MTTPTTSGTAPSNGLQIAYETFGDPDRPAVLLVMGLGTQMLGWPDELCQMIADRGHHVVRFDNRDVGLSTHLSDLPPPDVMAVLGGDTSSASYRLEDMADDAAGLLEHLGIDAAHVVGVSMGGMIAQALAIRHPGRVLSLTSISSKPGAQFGAATDAAVAALFTPAGTDLEANVERVVGLYRVIGSPGFPMDEPALRARAAEAFRRAYDPLGFLRQFAAIQASGDRSAALADLRVPTLVIHGREDPLVTLEGGLKTAEAIPDAKLDVIDGMGHDLPRALWPRLVDGIVANAQRAERN